MSTKIETFPDRITFSYHEKTLMTYVRKPEGTSPMTTAQYPYLHPVTTLEGHEVTEVKPATHPYLHGIFLAVQNVAETNFWGPATYLPSQGYVMRDDRGEIHGLGYESYESGERAGISEELSWVTKSGCTLLSEQRTIEVQRVDERRSCWVLGFSYVLRNVTEEWLHFTSPGSDGRRDATGRPGWGYGGLFWRGPQSMQNSDVIGPEVSGERELDGESTAWIAFVGRVAPNAKSTLIFVDDPTNHTSWYVNSAEYPGVGFGLATRQRRHLAPSSSLTRRHKIVVADGAWDRDEIAECAGSL